MADPLSEQYQTLLERTDSLCEQIVLLDLEPGTTRGQVEQLVETAESLRSRIDEAALSRGAGKEGEAVDSVDRSSRESILEWCQTTDHQFEINRQQADRRQWVTYLTRDLKQCRYEGRGRRMTAAGESVRVEAIEALATIEEDSALCEILTDHADSLGDLSHQGLLAIWRSMSDAEQEEMTARWPKPLESVAELLCNLEGFHPRVDESTEPEAPPTPTTATATDRSLDADNDSTPAEKPGHPRSRLPRPARPNRSSPAPIRRLRQPTPKPVDEPTEVVTDDSPMVDPLVRHEVLTPSTELDVQLQAPATKVAPDDTVLDMPPETRAPKQESPPSAIEPDVDEASAQRDDQPPIDAAVIRQAAWQATGYDRLGLAYCLTRIARRCTAPADQPARPRPPNLFPQR